MQRFGLTIPVGNLGLLDHQPLLERLADMGFTDVWSGEVDGVDAFTPLVLASQWAPEMRLGPAIVSVYTRGPALLAQTAAAMAAVAPGRFALGIGASSNVIVEQWNGLRFEQPLDRVRDTVRFLRSALAGEKVTENYSTFSVNGFRLASPPPKPVPLLVAALRPRMLELASTEADGAITNWLSPEDVRAVSECMANPGSELMARLFVLATEDRDTARAFAKRMMAQYLNVPVYAAFHKWLGRAEVLQPMWAAWRDGDRKKALELIPDSLVDELFAWGPPERVRGMIDRYVDNGVTCPVLMIFPFGDPIPYLSALRLN